MKKILVSGCGGSAANNFIRSLRLAPEKFYIIGTDVSKYHIKLSLADQNYISPYCDDPQYIDFINAVINKDGIDFLHCQPDTEVGKISELREKIFAKTLLPSKTAIRTAQNKLACTSRLKEFGVSVPMSFRIKTPTDIKIAIGIMQSKGISKFWVRAIEGAGSRASLPVTNYEDAQMWINYWDTMKDVKWGEFMISEFLPGKEYAFQSIWKDGELITSQARERIEYLFGSRMPSGQSSSPTVARTVSNDQVNEVSISGIKALDEKPNGIYCVDLKENDKGVPCITEINAGRFFTTSIFFSTAGINMPYLYIKSAFNETLPLVQKMNPLPEGLYWIRNIDMQERMVREDELTPNRINELL